MSSEANPIVELFRASIGKKLEGAPPMTTWLDGRIVSCEPGRMEVRFVTRPEMANPIGLLHGGMQAAIMDDVIGMTAATLGQEGVMLSIDLHVNYIGKLSVGQAVTARARFVRTGKRIAHAVCELVDEQGRVVSRGDSNLIKTALEPDYMKNPPVSKD
ncbi:MAG: PaaI family thioesterase [bacterium]